MNFVNNASEKKYKQQVAQRYQFIDFLKYTLYRN